MKQICRKNFNVMVTAIFLLNVASESVVSFAQGSGSSLDERIQSVEIRRLKNEFHQVVRGIVTRQLNSVGAREHEAIRVGIDLEVDQKKYSSDYKKWLKSKESEVKRHQQRIIKNQQEVLNSLASINNSDKEKKKTIEAQKKPKIRFGGLNIDLDPELTERLISEPESALEKLGDVSVSIQIPNIPMTNFGQFSFQIEDYVSKILIKIDLPKSAPAELDELIRNAIFGNLDLATVTSESPEKTISIARSLELKAPTAGDWSRTLFDPSNSTVPIAIGGLTLGLLLLISALIVSLVIGKIASGISSLKPEEKSESKGATDTESASAPQAAAIQEIALTTESDGGESGNSGYDSSAVSNALTSEMKTIRQEFGVIVNENRQIVAELLRDLFYDDQGLEDLRDLLAFAGYSILKPGLDSLPKSCLVDLRSYIEDSRDEASSLLNGVEVTQRIYRDCITKVVSGGGADPKLDSLRGALVQTGDEDLIGIVDGAESGEVAVLLKILTVERGNQLFQRLSQDKLKDAVGKLDTSFDDLSDEVTSLMKKISSIENKAIAKPIAKTRFILRMARGASIDGELLIDELIESDDLELRRKVMENKFFYRDLLFLNPEFLRAVLLTFSVPFRGDFLSTVQPELRDLILDSFKEGTKLKEMMKSELTQIERSEKRREKIADTKPVIIEKYMDVVRTQLRSEPKQIRVALENYCDAKGIAKPETLSSANQNTAQPAAS